MPPSPNVDGLPVGRHFQMAAIEISGYIFAYNSKIDRVKILVSKPMFMGIMNPMITLKKSLGLLVNSKFKMVAYKTSRNHNGPNTGNTPHMYQPGKYESYLILSLGLIPT